MERYLYVGAPFGGYVLGHEPDIGNCKFGSLGHFYREFAVDVAGNPVAGIPFFNDGGTY